MDKQIRSNQGFSLIELLIAITMLSIIMLMVGHFMSSSTAAYKRTEKNLNVQSDAMSVMDSLQDNIQQAKYIRVELFKTNQVAYTITDTSGSGSSATRTRTVAESNEPLTSDKLAKVDYGFVPDDYGNYVRPETDPTTGKASTERKVIIDYDTYELLGEVDGTKYPLTGDLDAVNQNVRSFRALRKNSVYYYVMPEYIYLEKQNADDDTKVDCYVYRFVKYTDTGDSSKTKYKMYMAKKTLSSTYNNRYLACKAGLASPSDDSGLVTRYLSDFYLSADVDGNALLINAMFDEKGYQYNAVQTVKFRNTNVLTVRPQKLYKKKGSGATLEGLTPTSWNDRSRYYEAPSLA